MARKHIVCRGIMAGIVALLTACSSPTEELESAISSLSMMTPMELEDNSNVELTEASYSNGLAEFTFRVTSEDELSNYIDAGGYESRRDIVLESVQLKQLSPILMSRIEAAEAAIKIKVTYNDDFDIAVATFPNASTYEKAVRGRAKDIKDYQ